MAQTSSPGFRRGWPDATAFDCTAIGYRVVAQFRSTLEPPALYLTATEFALTQTCPDLPSDSAPHI